MMKLQNNRDEPRSEPTAATPASEIPFLSHFSLPTRAEFNAVVHVANLNREGLLDRKSASIKEELLDTCLYFSQVVGVALTFEGLLLVAGGAGGVGKGLVEDSAIHGIDLIMLGLGYGSALVGWSLAKWVCQARHRLAEKHSLEQSPCN